MTAANKFIPKANELKLLGVPWFDLPLSIRRLWWRETDYGRRPPSPELMIRLPQLLADAQREAENDKRDRVAYATEARARRRQACEQCLPDLNEEQTRAFDAQMQAALEGDPPVFEPKEERALFEQRYAAVNPRWNRIPEARRRFLEELSTKLLEELGAKDPGSLQLPESFKVSRESGTKHAIIGSPFLKPKDPGEG